MSPALADSAKALTPHAGLRTPQLQGIGLRIVIAAEGSGGHLIPALQVARELARGGHAVRVLCAQRPRTVGLFRALIEEAAQDGVRVEPVTLNASAPGLRVIRPLSGWLQRAHHARLVWRKTQELFAASMPDVVAGFGGGFCVPVVLAARQQRVPVLIHEQNVTLGRANRWLARWADAVAVSFEATRRMVPGTCVMTGLPVRAAIGTVDRTRAAERLGLSAEAPTVLVIGGSQGAHALNALVCGLLPALTVEERAQWQLIHGCGPEDLDTVRTAYAAAGLTRTVVEAHVTDMASAYAAADVVISRSGASTIAEVASAGKPSLLIPYPYAQSHQRQNARLIETVGGGLWCDESRATPSWLLDRLRELLADPARRQAMGERVRVLAMPRAAQHVAEALQALVAERRVRHLEAVQGQRSWGRATEGVQESSMFTDRCA